MTERIIGTAVKDINPSKEDSYIYKTDIPGLLIIKRPLFSDTRGFFQELYRVPDLEKVLGRPVVLKQQSVTGSIKGTIKGIHAENQDKLVVPHSGRIIQVVVDLNPGSPSFKKWLMLDFNFKKGSHQPKTCLFIGEGLGNAYCILRAGPGGLAEYMYTVSKTYNSLTADMGVRWNDPEIAIPWPIQNPQLSERDKSMPSLEQFLKKYR